MDVIEFTEKKIETLEKLIREYQAGSISAQQLKSFRVPMGVYEQREDNTYMMRVRVPAGELDLHKILSLAQIAERYDKPLHLTTRQDIQIHDVSLEEILPIYRALLRAGLSCIGGGGNTVRNIAGCPLSGLSPSSAFDVGPYVKALTQFLLVHEESYNLPRKYKIAFSDCEEDCALATASDLGFIATRRDGRKGFVVFAAGGLGAVSKAGFKLLDFVEDRDIFALALAVREVFDKYGDRHNRHRARLRFVRDKIGDARLKELILEAFARIKKTLVPPPIPDSTILVAENQREYSISPDIGFESWFKAFGQPQNIDGYYIFRVPFPLGEISAADLKALYDLATKLNGIGFRLTNDGAIYIYNVKKQNAPFLYNFLRKYGLATVDDARYHIKSCKGVLTCRLGICHSMGLARAIAKELNQAGIIPPYYIHISGCPNACGQHPVAKLGFFGAARRINGHLAPYYKVVFGAKISPAGSTLAEVISEIPAKNVPLFVRQVFEQGLNTAAEIRALANKFQDIPSFEEEPSYYKDWESRRTFSLNEIKPGECGAGVFELIAFEIREAEHLFQVQQYEGAFIQICKALLVIKGVMTDEPEEIKQLFKKYFIDEGWVARKYLKLYDTIDTELLRGIIQRVKQLFESLDSSLNFNIEREEQPESIEQDSGAAAADGVEFLDLKGVPCPINFVKSKMYLEPLPPGTLVDIILDDGEPIRNVPQSLENEGHRILYKKQLPDGRFVIRVKKAGGE